jgi:hypothetical protein
MKRIYLSYDQIFWFGIFLILVPVAGLRLLGPDADYFNYLNLLTLQNSLELLTKEFGFRLLLGLNSVVFNANVNAFFLIFAFLGISIKFYAFAKISPIPLLSLGLYLFSYFLLHDYTQIRAGVASGIFLLSMQDLSEGAKKQYFQKVIWACLFHWTALIMIPIYFLVRRLSIGFFALLPFIGIMIFLTRINFEQYILSGIADYPALMLYYASHSGHNSTVNIFNLINLGFLGMFMGISALIYYMKEEFTDFEIDLFKVFSTSIFAFYFFAILNKPVVAFRIFEFLNISLLLLVPFVVLKFKQWYLASLVFIAFFLLYFYHLLINVRVIP